MLVAMRGSDAEARVKQAATGGFGPADHPHIITVTAWATRPGPCGEGPHCSRPQRLSKRAAGWTPTVP